MVGTRRAAERKKTLWPGESLSCTSIISKWFAYHPHGEALSPRRLELKGHRRVAPVCVPLPAVCNQISSPMQMAFSYSSSFLLDDWICRCSCERLMWMAHVNDAHVDDARSWITRQAIANSRSRYQPAAISMADRHWYIFFFECRRKEAKLIFFSGCLFLLKVFSFHRSICVYHTHCSVHTVCT